MSRRRGSLGIVPRLLKNAVTVGVIPACATTAVVGCGERLPPVVAAYGDSRMPPVVAAYVPIEELPEPPDAGVVDADAGDAGDAGVDAGVDAGPPKK